MTFLQTSTSIDCLVEVCPGRETIHTNLRLHLTHWHVEETIVFLNYVPGLHPWCDQCNIFITWEAMVVGHLGTTMYKSGGKRNHHHLSATAVQVTAGT